MSTVNATSVVSQNNVAQFLNLWKPTKKENELTVHGVRDMLLLCNKYATICIGDHSGDEIAFKIDARELQAYIRSAKSGAEITFSVTQADDKNFSLVLECERVGEVSLVQKNIGPWSQRDVFESLGSYQETISLNAITEAATIIDRTDPESSRFALSNILFDEDNIIATDGRRLARTAAVSDGDVEMIDEPTIVRIEAIQYAVKFGYDIDVFKDYMIAGDLVVKRDEGRYPNWRMVTPKDQSNKFIVSGDELRAAIDKALARRKATKGEARFEFPVLDGAIALVDPDFLKTAVGKLKQVTLTYGAERQEKFPDYVATPLMITSAERPSWFEFIMPMARDRK